MAMLDLSRTTVALQRLLELNIPQLEPALAGALTISTLPPERVQGGPAVLSLYCYHVSPDPSNRYRPRQSGGDRPIATSPLTLILNYILTAHTLVGTDFNALAEQQLLGLAMKTLHDFPVIDDATQVAGQAVLPDEIRGRNNRFGVTQMVLTPGEALNYWSNESQMTVKPSGYYEVAAAELIAEPPSRLPGVVLSLGAFVHPMDGPVLDRTQSEVAFAQPPGAGGGGVVLAVSPARIGPPDPALPLQNLLRLTGRGLTAGESQEAEIVHPLWTRHFPGGRAPLDMAANAGLGWALEATDAEAAVTLGDALRATPATGPSVDLPLYPGTYLVAWRITRAVERDGAVATLTERSNAIPFGVHPRIVSTARHAPSGRVTLGFGGSWLLTRGRAPGADPVLEPELDIQLSVDGRAYALVPGATPATPGDFTIADHALTYAPLPEHDAPGDHSLRVIVDGADSQPFWIAIP